MGRLQYYDPFYDPFNGDLVHVVEVTLQLKEYSATVHYKIGGNVKGHEALEDPASILLHQWERGNAPNETVEVVGDDVVVSLKNKSGEVLEYEIFDEHDLERIIVGVRIVEVREEGDDE